MCATQYILLPKQLYLQFFIVASPWCGLRPLASATLTRWDPPGCSFFRYPIVALCYGDPVALLLQDCSLHVFQQFIDEVGRCWGGPAQGLGSEPGWWVGCLAYRFSWAHASRASSSAFPRQGSEPAFLSVAIGKRQDWLSHAHATRVSSPDLLVGASLRHTHHCHAQLYWAIQLWVFLYLTGFW